MSAQDNKQLTLDFFEQVLNRGDLELIPRALSPDYRFNGEPQTADNNARWVQGLHASYPELRFTVEAILAEDDLVALRWRLDARAAGERPAGTVRGTNIIRFESGLAVDNQQNGGRTSSLNAY